MKRSLMLSAAFGAACLAAGAAGSATISLGNSAAHECFEAARAHLGGSYSLQICNSALEDDALAADQRVATLVNRGIVRMVDNDLNGAVADFDVAIASDPKQPEAFLNKGLAVLKREGDAKAARALFDAALAKRTVKPELAYYGRGVADERLGDVRGAYQDYRRAEELAPTWDEPKQELARFQVVNHS